MYSSTMRLSTFCGLHRDTEHYYSVQVKHCVLCRPVCECTEYFFIKAAITPPVPTQKWIFPLNSADTISTIALLFSFSYLFSSDLSFTYPPSFQFSPLFLLFELHCTKVSFFLLFYSGRRLISAPSAKNTIF